MTMCVMQSRRLMHNSAYHTVYKTIRNEMSTKGERPSASEDPLQHTAGEVMSSNEILQMCQYLMKANSTAADRDLSLNNRLLSVCGRSDDGRLVYQADFCPPRLIKSLGESCILPACAVYSNKQCTVKPETEVAVTMLKSPHLCVPYPLMVPL